MTDTTERAKELLAGITPGKWSVTYETSEQPPYERYAYAIHGPRDHSVDVPHVSDDYRAMYGNQITEIVGLSDEDAEFIAAAPELVADLVAEVERVRSACKTLGNLTVQLNQMALDATGLHHLIGEDGDGDWAAVWDKIAELGAASRG